MKYSQIRMDLRIAFLYALCGGLWILLSDRALAALVDEKTSLITVQIYKGWFFVFGSALLIFFLLRREMVRSQRTEKSLRESEERYRQLFENSMDAILLTAPDGSIFAANPAACRMFDHSEAEIIRLGRSGIMDTSDPRLEQALAERARRGSFHGELTFLRSDGAKFPGEITTSLFKNREGQERTSMIIRDITERKRAEEVLNQWAHIFEHAQWGVAVSSADEKTLAMINPAFASIHGYSVEELTGKPITAVYTPDSLAELPKHIRIAHEKGHHTFESNHLRKDGSAFPVLMDVTAVKDEQGQLAYRVVNCQDISELKQAERRLQESEMRFMKAFHVSPVGINMFSLTDNRSIDVNDAFLQVAGYSRQEVVGHSAAELGLFVEPETRNVWMKSLAEHGIARNLETKIRRKSGEIRDVLASIVVTEINGDMTGLVVMTDITDHKLAEMALKESEERYRQLLDVSPVGIAVHCEGKLVFANPAGARILGARSSEEVVGKSILEIVHPDNQAIARDRIQRMLAGEQGLYPTEDRYLRLDGSEVPVQVFAAPLTYEGKPAVQVIVQDISERKLAEIQIQTLNERLQLLIAAIQELASARDLEAVITAVRSYARKLTSCDGATFVLRQDDHCYYADEDAISPLWKGQRFPMSACISGWAMLHAQPVVIEDVFSDARIPKEIYRATFVKSLVMVPIRTPKPIGAIGNYWARQYYPTEVEVQLLQTLADAAARAMENVQLLETLELRVAERTAQLTFANKQLESFSYSVSHDLRAPLRAISGFAAIIARRHRQALDEEGQHYFDNIVQASDRMSQLIDDLLAYSRIGRSGVRRVAISLEEILSPIVSDLQGHLAGLCGKIELAEGLPTVQGDATLLNQIFSNLIENALTYRKPDHPPFIRIDYQQEGAQVIIQVSDNGIGIPAGHHEKIFNIFQRLHSDDEYPGTGIGLATVKKAVDLLGGAVWVESKVGEGSTFFVKLHLG